MATRDVLTNLPNRRAFFDRAGEAALRGEGSPVVSIVMFDIDHFKRVNDTWGHDVGDEVLKAVAALVERCPGRPARLGGEEFAILFEGWDLLDAYHEAERLRVAVAEHQILGEWGAMQVTISLGVAEHRIGQSVDQVLKAADVALYAAKTGGRNRTIATQASMGLDRDEPKPVQTIYLAC
jgi:diguanylate cyclase (GGDEF)-like protein